MHKLNFSQFILLAGLYLMLIPQNLFSQGLDAEFLEGLDPNIREQLEGQNSEKDPELEALFRSDTSLTKNKEILKNLKSKIEDLDAKLNEDDSENALERFGESFFSSIQSSFMPINIPNTSGNYIVDVGDSFTILLTGKDSKEHQLEVQRDGSLLIPDYGKILVAGSRLDQVENKIIQFIGTTSLGVNSFITLSKMRDVQILLMGGIVSPGIYTISAGSNLLHALNVAGGISANGSFRKIEHRRGGEVLSSIDLYPTLVYGEPLEAAALRSGDTIFITPISFQIPVSGGINNPAIYEMLNGESLEDILNFAGGLSESFYGHKFVKVKMQQLNSNAEAEVQIKDFKQFELAPRYSIVVPTFQSNYETTNTISINGMVQRPGIYSIDEGETLRSVVKRAGGYKTNAYTYGGALFRESVSLKEKEYAKINYADTINYLIDSLAKPGASFGSQTISLLTQELQSKSYSGRIVTDFSSINTNSAVTSIKLEHGDKIVIPSMQRVVYMFGDFKNQANLTYDPNYSVNDYVKLGGGLQESAKGYLLVISPDGKTQIHKRKLFNLSGNIDIYPGSIIYAPRELGKLDGVLFASSVAPILSNVALTLASLNSISD